MRSLGATGPPVIGVFLRSCDDRLDDRGREDLYALAAKGLGTRSRIAVHLPGRLRRWLQS